MTSSRRVSIMVLLLLSLLCVEAEYDHDCNTRCVKANSYRNGFYKNLPCNECGTGKYRSCPKGSVDAYNNRTMCVRATKALYTHVQAKEMCNRLGGFLAFAANQTELEAIAKNEMLKLKQEGKTCLAARTVPEKQGNKDVWKLYPMKCDEFLPAACYSYKQVPKYYCGPTDHQKEWFLFRGMCYYLHYATEASKFTSYFAAQEQCHLSAYRGSKSDGRLARVQDQDTNDMIMNLYAGGLVTSIRHGIWIGLQIGSPSGNRYDYQAEKWVEYKGGNSQLSAGYWEDGTEYWKWKEESFARTPTGEVFQYFADGEPSRSKFKKKCTEENDVDMKNPRSAYGCDYQWLEYCASLIPLRSDVVSSKNEERLQHVKKFAGGRWNDYWCFVPIAGYVCERPADRFIPPEDVDPFEGV